MPSLPAVVASNARIASELPSGLVAVFIGATSGIGLVSMSALVRHARRPRVYFVGRSQEAADKIIVDSKAVNPEAEMHFIRSDVSLLKKVDEVCREIRSKETHINLLFQTQGTLILDKKTDEGLRYVTALTFYSKSRFIHNLLPLLEAAPSLRRVVSVMAAGKEGEVDVDDIEGNNVGMMSARGHLCTLFSLSLDTFSKRAPTVSFVHNFPGHVKGNLIRGGEPLLISVLGTLFRPLQRFTCMPDFEAGERHLYLATSAAYPASSSASADGIALATGEAVATGMNGVPGSGSYSIDERGDSTGPTVATFLQTKIKEGAAQKIQADSDAVFKRVCG